jgi:hypothetical protein
LWRNAFERTDVVTAMDTHGYIPRYVVAFAVMVALLVLPGLIAQL